MNARQRYLTWLNDENIDNKTKKELQKIEAQDNEIYDRFSKQLEFGTGGLRGIMGTGTNRMNIYTVRLATQALAQFLLNHNYCRKGVTIACDSRNMSKEFVEVAAEVLIGNGIPVYVFKQICPTPMLSFAVRFCKADGGIMITASHNPKEYNGYKVYNSDGVQILPEPAHEISVIMQDLTLSDVKLAENPMESHLWHWIGENVYRSYFQHLAQITAGDQEQDLSLRILYTPLHGAGAQFVPRALREAGFKHIDCVAEQCILDGDFPTVELPNPEEPEAFSLAFRYAADTSYDLIMATDPDGDRVGVAIFDGIKFVLLTGNQVGVLLTDYLLQRLSPHQLHNKVIVKTIVTTDMIKEVAKQYGVEVIDTLTGFKYIGSAIKELQNQGKEFMLGLEESCGYLVGTFVRDKDAIMICSIIAQMTAYYKKRGLTLIDRLMQLMDKHGYHLDILLSYYFDSTKEFEKAEAFMEDIRHNSIYEIGGLLIRCFKDYKNGVMIDIENEVSSKFEFPTENVLQWETIENDCITMRLSGTEPKMKLYISIVAKQSELAECKLAKIEQACDRLINQGLSPIGSN